jgi:RNA polymerase sigma-70 factor (ECF subfamily)
MTSSHHLSPAPNDDDESQLDFEQIYDKYFGFAWSNLRRFGVRDRHLEDAVQDLFLVVHRRLGEFEGRSSLRTWLAGIAWRVASDYRRHESRKGGVEALTDTFAAKTHDPHGMAVHAEAMRQLDQILRQLDDDKRVVFVLTELEEMSVPEIAEAIGVNLNTVYARLRAARKSFNEELERQKRSER